MDWLIKRNHLGSFADQENKVGLDFSIETVSLNKKNFNINPLKEFIILNYYEEHVKLMAYLDIKSEVDFNQILNEIAPLFSEGKIVSTNSTPFQIMLSNLHHEYVEHINHGKLNIITQELFGPKLSGEFASYQQDGPLDIYLIDKEKITPYFNYEFDEVFNFMESKNVKSINPVNWHINKMTKELKSIRYFVGKCNEVMLLVNPKTNLVNHLLIDF
ncbi:hypothetical protein [Alkalihalobacillus trypoxylicola]|uniref:Uncharacterized protein n=1 Tax=Alkalihalobacillus trypoxylicola TaxID=519424 RepID=A0A162DNY7_9BACI|nr:hypothetical protein [Alkalihalobacillus trypoxylicola]KYG30431.1 hypothetical protein AZF04_19910 [Alkalihalobacillus trypoxylicola]